MFFDTLLHVIIIGMQCAHTDDVFWKSVLTCTFDMHDELVTQEIKKCISHTKRDLWRLAIEAFSIWYDF